jgi:cytochrome b561
VDDLPSRYSAAQKVLHWTMAVLIVVMVAVGLTMTNMGDGPLKNALYELHKSTGLLVLVLALIRVAVRRTRSAPPLEPMPEWQRIAAYTSHYSMYVLIVLVPLMGWIATSYCCKPVNLFWTVPVSLPIPNAPTMEASRPLFLIHFALAFTLAAIVTIHVTAALHHHFVRRDRTLLRMLPGGDGTSAGPVR